ncbi:hypothetical protein ASPWEDRAFT_46570 [Aspergillus wentii DTO 134E9]|uniref:tripeptidyl-peptidase II n=1 Tax=Aspergillus wentii DTO 134E9 TaxID=1073089 RepID=A0A1L9R4H0_ASPWE|nr:uncharacterized protein ASPWEDRAFT_46570 [Aspergillus wentii DTO 134E9]KAI9927087.1 vesicle formation at the endoplasmic reticulum [Aspergillus wentii]OJJ29808.1 hypothetical protein ASPWEDRAFT_46570 [Aspergillus wentii DTO 134E9]
MRSSTLLGALFLVVPSLAVVHEHLASVPSGWKRISNAPKSDKIVLSIALARQNLDQLESKLAALSTPGEEQYGQWMDQKDVDEAFPTSNDDDVMEWLKAAGISHIHREGSLLNFASTVGEANTLLNTTFAYYTNGNAKKLRTTHYSLPDNLAPSIDLVSPTVFFGKDHGAAARSHKAHKSSKAIKREDTSNCADIITPACLKEMYNFKDYTPDPSSGSRVGFSSFLNQSALYSDLATYEKLFQIPSQNFSVELIHGGVNDQNPNTAQSDEANLDAQLQIAVAHPLPMTEFITGGSPPFIPNADEPSDNQNEPYLQYYEYLLSKENAALPQVITNSYGDDEQTVPEFYAKRVCNLIGLMGLRGISVLESSGDTGIGSACMTNDGSKKPVFTPTFPGTCPYLTSVGGTQSYAPEIAWTGSSGGFSNYFPRAWYQKKAVEGYLAHQITPDTKKYYSHYANFSGRGFPDVAAHSDSPSYAITVYGQIGGIGGTSAANPVFGAIIGLLNDARLRAGKPTLGFLNPLIYSEAWKTFTDITAGKSVGCDGIDPQSGSHVNGSGIIPFAHWNATTGWDPVTGFGVPNFEKLKELVLSL